MWLNCSHSVPWSLGPNLITTGINATYDPISPLTAQLSNIGGSRSTNSVHVCKCVHKSWPLITSSAKNKQNEIWHPTKNGLIWLSTYQEKPSCDPTSWSMWPVPMTDLQLTFFPLWLKITKLLIQCSLMSWTKFQYHAHQWHLTPHFMSHIAIVGYKRK